MTRTTSRIAAVLAVLVGLTGSGIAIAASPAGPPRWNEVAVGALYLAYGGVALLILWHRPTHAIGWIALPIAPLGGMAEALVAMSYATLQHHPDARLAALGSVFGSFLRGPPWFLAVMWLPLRFPDGRPEGTRLGRFAERWVIATIASFAIQSLFAAKLPDVRLHAIDNPIGVPPSLAAGPDLLAGVNLILGMVAIGLAVTCLIRRYRRGGPLSRQQTLIFGLAFIPPISTLVLSFTDAAPTWLFGVASIPLPLAIGVAVLQRRLYDIQLVVNRSLAYGTLWLAIAAVYALTIEGVGAIVRHRGAVWLPWLAAGVVAVTFAPLRDGLQRAANRLTYGQWSQAAQVLASTARRLGDASDVPSLLHSLVEDVGAALDLPYIAITDPQGHPLAAHGAPVEAVEEIPMTSYGGSVGILSWAARRPLREADRALLTDLARQLGTVVHAAGLLDAIRASQERLVIAREEERRRLRRDLHDGLGPTLAGLTLRVDTLRNELSGALDGAVTGDADAGLLALRSDIQAAMVDVRRIVEGLRPPALDELGLADAVIQLADRIVAGSDLDVEVQAEPMARLPAAVEVAAYRIIQEALTNTLRHAAARNASVRLRRDPRGLAIEVCDDGSGQVVARPNGVGLASMRERAQEINGAFTLRARPGEGTTVAVLLPAPAESGAQVTR